MSQSAILTWTILVTPKESPSEPHSRVKTSSKLSTETRINRFQQASKISHNSVTVDQATIMSSTTTSTRSKCNRFQKTLSNRQAHNGFRTSLFITTNLSAWWVTNKSTGKSSSASRRLTEIWSKAMGKEVLVLGRSVLVTQRSLPRNSQHNLRFTHKNLNCLLRQDLLSRRRRRQPLKQMTVD